MFKIAWRKFKKICDDIEFVVECGQRQGKEFAFKKLGGCANGKKKKEKN